MRGSSYSIGYIGRTPISLNLRGYVGLFIGGVKVPDAPVKVFDKVMIGFEYYTGKHVAVFIEIGRTGAFTDDKTYSSINQGLAMSGVRFYF